MSREEGARPATARSLDVSACLLAQAEASFERGDMQQASGKAWGAVAECVESASKENGWRNQSDRGISASAGKLLDLTPDPKGNRRKFAVIDFLRVNYFDYELDPEDVARAVRDARALVEAVREVAPTHGRGPGTSRDRPGQALEAHSLDVAACLLVQAEAAFENGDVARACEKAWDAVARCAESVFRANGWPNGSDGDVVKGVKRLLDRTFDPKGNHARLVTLNYLHVNYFDEERRPEDVARAIGEARALVDAIRELETVRNA